MDIENLSLFYCIIYVFEKYFKKLEENEKSDILEELIDKKFINEDGIFNKFEEDILKFLFKKYNIDKKIKCKILDKPDKNYTDCIVLCYLSAKKLKNDDLVYFVVIDKDYNILYNPVDSVIDSNLYNYNFYNFVNLKIY